MNDMNKLAQGHYADNLVSIQKNQIEFYRKIKFIFWSKIFSLLVGLVGIGVIIGWIFEIDFLKRILPNFIPMKVNAAFCFILISISLLIQSATVVRSRLLIVIAKLLAWIVLLIGLLTFMEYIFNWDLGIDQLLIYQSSDFPVYHPPGRMAPLTAVVFMLTGVSLLLIHVKHTVILIQTLAFTTGVFSLFVLTGFTYHIHTTYQIVPFAYASIHATFNFLFVSLALLFMQPDKGIMRVFISETNGGKFARLLTPIIISVSVIVGYFRLLGENYHLYDKESGVALFASANICIIIIIIIFALTKLMHADYRRKKIESELAESEMRWKFALESANQGVWDWHIPEKVIYFSHAWKRMLGYQDNEITNEQIEFESRVHPDDLEKVWKNLNDHFNQKTPEYICEVRFRCKDGSYKWILDRGKAIARGQDGQVVRAIGTHTDITDLKFQLQAQALMTEKFHLALDAAQLGSWDLNLQTNKIERTPLHDQIFGYSSLLPEWTYDMMLNHVHPDDRESVKQSFKEANDKKQNWEFKCRIHRADDHRLCWIWQIAKHIYIENVPHLLGLIQDITKNEEADQKLKETALYTRTLIEASLDPLMTISQDGKITDVNSATEAATEVSRGKLIGRDFSIYFTDPEIAQKGLQQAFNAGFVKDYPLTFKTASNRLRNVICNAVVYKDMEGKLAGIFFAARDITERKKAEEKVIQYAAELEKSNNELQQFAYIASHDLQEPLRMISSYLQLISQRYKNKLDKDADEFIDFAVSGAMRLQKMINDLLVYSHVDTQAKPFTVVDSNTVLDYAIENLKMLINEHKAIITRDSLPTLRVDESQLIQVFQNLISNAIKFRRDVPPKIHISAQLKNKEWLFSVSDNGIGIDPKYKDQLFVIFKRLVGKEYTGSGIGLAVCKRIIERHKGKIWVDSTLGEGTTFYFTLPAEISLKSSQK